MRLSDLEICMRMAIIEGIPYCINKGMDGEFVDLSLDDEVSEFNPLTDDALCFQLMVKYRIRFMYETNPDYYHASRVVHEQNKKPFRVCESDENPNKAICLAIIEANK